MRNIHEIPAKPRTAFKVERLQVLEGEFGPKSLRPYSISEERAAPAEYTYGEPVPKGRSGLPQDDVQGHRLLPERALVNERITVYSGGEEPPLPIRDAVIEGSTLNKWRRFVASIRR